MEEDRGTDTSRNAPKREVLPTSDNYKFVWQLLPPDTNDRQHVGDTVNSLVVQGSTHSWDADDAAHGLWVGAMTDSRSVSVRNPSGSPNFKKKPSDTVERQNSVSPQSVHRNSEKSGPHLLADAQTELQKLLEFHRSFMGFVDTEGALRRPGLFSFAPQRFTFVGQDGLRYRRTEARELIEYEGFRVKAVFKTSFGHNEGDRESAHSFGETKAIAVTPIEEQPFGDVEYEECVVERFTDDPELQQGHQEISLRWKGDQSFHQLNNTYSSLDGSFRGRMVYSRLKEDASQGTLLIVEGGRLSSYREGKVQYIGEGLPSSPTGIGHWTDRDGDYRGEFLDGLRHGWGVHSCSEWPTQSPGLTPQGSKSMLWSKNLSSKSLRSIASPVERAGRWDGGLRDGPAQDTSPEEKFIGYYKEGLKNGSASASSEGNEFYGTYQNGHRCGVGTFQSATRTYIGEWQEDLPHGGGLERLSNETYFGGWSSGLRDGLGILYTSTSKDEGYFGYFKSGELHGLVLPIRSNSVRKSDARIFESGVQTEKLPLPSRIQDLFLRFPKFDMTEFITTALQSIPTIKQEVEVARKELDHHLERIEACLAFSKSEVELEMALLTKAKSDLRAAAKTSWEEFNTLTSQHGLSAERALQGDFPTQVEDNKSEVTESDNFEDFEEYLDELRSDRFKTGDGISNHRLERSSTSKKIVKLENIPPNEDAAPRIARKDTHQSVDKKSKADDIEEEITIVVEEDPEDKAASRHQSATPLRSNNYQQVGPPGISLICDVHQSTNPDNILEILLVRTHEIEQAKQHKQQLETNRSSSPNSVEKIAISEAKDSRMEEDSTPEAAHKKTSKLLEYGKIRERSKSPSSYQEKTLLEKSRQELLNLKVKYRKIAKQSPSKTQTLDEIPQVERGANQLVQNKQLEVEETNPDNKDVPIDPYAPQKDQKEREVEIPKQLDVPVTKEPEQVFLQETKADEQPKSNPENTEIPLTS